MERILRDRIRTGTSRYIYHFLRSSRLLAVSSGLTMGKALFNVMLREFGVKGVKVQEVISLDEEMMEFLK